MEETLKEILETLVAIKKRLDESLPTLAEQNEAWDTAMSGAKATFSGASSPEQKPP